MENSIADNGLARVVLVPTDFSDVCRNAIYHGVKLARNRGFRVCILHVITKKTKAMLRKKHVKEEYIDWKLKEYKKYYEKRYDISIDTLSVEGDIFTTIAVVARQVNAALMILGTHGKQGLQHFLGSYALKVVLESPVPVILVQKITYRDKYSKIVFPLTHGIRSEEAVYLLKAASGIFDVRFHVFLWPEQNADIKNSLETLTRLASKVFNKEDMPDIVITSYKSADFDKEVLNYTLTQHADAIMLVNVSNPRFTGFRISAVDESLMFNKEQIPVICINTDYLKQMSARKAIEGKQPRQS